MSINYYLQKNYQLHTDPDDCSARVASKDTLELDGVIDEMLKRGTTLDKVELSGTHLTFTTALLSMPLLKAKGLIRLLLR